MSTIGRNAKLITNASERGRVRAFYEGILGATHVAPKPDMDLYKFPDGFSLGVEFVDAAHALSVDDAKKGAWLEVVVDDVAATKARLGDLGITPFDYVDRAHTYFQAPGGQVFRLAPRGGTV